MASDVEAILYRRLRSIPALLCLRGRIYPLIAPPGTVGPYCLYMRQASPPDQTFMGPMRETAVTFQVAVYHQTYQSARALAKALRHGIDGWHGTVAGNRILRAAVLSDADTYIQAEGGDLLPFYGVNLTIEIRAEQYRKN